MLYCEHCGAANAIDAHQCFACQQTLEPGTASTQLEPLETLSTDDKSVAHLTIPPEPLVLRIVNGHYRILNQVGTGGYGAVYKAIDEWASSTPVAIKEIRLKGLKAQEIIEATDTFNREVHILSELRHQNLPRIYDHFTDPEHWYLVMDFIEGQTLEEYLNSTRGNLPVGDVCHLGIQLCSVLEYLHDRQPPIIFRDVKPSNIMLTPFKQVYLIDFGTARLFKPGRPRDTIAFGSPGYAAPEQYGKAQTTPRSDIYSLGATLHMLLSGLDPAESPFKFALLRSINNTIPVELEILVARMVEMNAEKRPASATEVRTELQRISVEHGRRLYPTFTTSTPQPVWLPGTSVNPPPPFQPGNAGGQVQMQMPHPQKQATSRKGLSRRTIIGGLVVMAVVGPNILKILENFHQPQPFSSDGDSSIHKNPPQMNYLNVFYMQGSINAITWTDDEEVVAASSNHTINVYRYDNDLAQRTYIDHDTAVVAVSFNNHSSHPLVASADTQTINIWKSQSGVTVTTIADSTTQGIKVLTWSPVTNQFAYGGEDHIIHIAEFDPYSNKVSSIMSYTGHKNAISSLSWSPDGTRIASAGQDNEVHVWSTKHVSGNRVKQPEIIYNKHSSKVTAVAWSPADPDTGVSRDFILSADTTGKVYIWMPTENDSIPEAHFTYNGSVKAVAWSPDSHYVAFGGDGENTIVIGDISNNTIFRVYSNPTSLPILSLAWDQYTGNIASGDASGAIFIWKSPS